MKLRHVVAAFTVGWLALMVHCLWPAGYGRYGEMAIIGALLLGGIIVCATVRSVERDSARRRIENARAGKNTRRNHLYSVPQDPAVHELPIRRQ